MHSNSTARCACISSVEEMASDLELLLGSARHYLTNAIAELGARDRIDAIRVACEAGWR